MASPPLRNPRANAANAAAARMAREIAPPDLGYLAQSGLIPSDRSPLQAPARARRAASLRGYNSYASRRLQALQPGAQRLASAVSPFSSVSPTPATPMASAFGARVPGQAVQGVLPGMPNGAAPSPAPAIPRSLPSPALSAAQGVLPGMGNSLVPAAANLPDVIPTVGGPRPMPGPMTPGVWPMGGATTALPFQAGARLGLPAAGTTGTYGGPGTYTGSPTAGTGAPVPMASAGGPRGTLSGLAGEAAGAAGAAAPLGRMARFGNWLNAPLTAVPEGTARTGLVNRVGGMSRLGAMSLGAGIAGGLLDAKTDSDAWSRVGNALALGGTGASFGSYFGPWGTAIGGIGGAGIGALMGGEGDAGLSSEDALGRLADQGLAMGISPANLQEAQTQYNIMTNLMGQSPEEALASIGGWLLQVQGADQASQSRQEDLLAQQAIIASFMAPAYEDATGLRSTAEGRAYASGILAQAHTIPYINSLLAEQERQAAGLGSSNFDMNALLAGGAQ